MTKVSVTGAIATGLAAAALGAIAVPAQAHPREDVRKILVVLAHPDDELFIAPAIARAAREGAEVSLVYATSGDQGPGVSDYPVGETLAEVRRSEAMCAADALGAARAISLGLGDGTLGAGARLTDSSAKRLLALLPDTLAQADVVVTWGPEGGYGHSDHRMVGAVVTQHVQAIAEGERPLLLYPALVHAPLPDLLASQGWTTTAPDIAGVRFAYSDADLVAANAATQCHETQFDAATRAALVPGFDAAVWKGEVAFRRAF